MAGHGLARPGTHSRSHGGMPQGGRHSKGERWERAPARSARLLRVFFALAVLSMAVATIMIIHLLTVPR
jgi:hypothetical protein